MRKRTGLRGLALACGCIWLGACRTEPTGVRPDADRNYSVGVMPTEEWDGRDPGGVQTTVQSDTTARGIGGFGSGN